MVSCASHLSPYKYKTYRRAKAFDIFYVSASPSEWVLAGLDRMSVDRGGPRIVCCVYRFGWFVAEKWVGQGIKLVVSFWGAVWAARPPMYASVRNDVQPKVENRSTIGRLSRCQFYVFVFNYVERIFWKIASHGIQDEIEEAETGIQAFYEFCHSFLQNGPMTSALRGRGCRNHGSTHKTMYLAHPILGHLVFTKTYLRLIHPLASQSVCSCLVCSRAFHIQKSNTDQNCSKTGNTY